MEEENGAAEGAKCDQATEKDGREGHAGETEAVFEEEEGGEDVARIQAKVSRKG